jgi:hypothetical protein
MQQQLHQMNLAQSQRQPVFQHPSARPPMPPMPPMPPPQMFQQQQIPLFNPNQHQNQMQWQQQNMTQAPTRRNRRSSGRGNSKGQGYFRANYQNPFNAQQ